VRARYACQAGRRTRTVDPGRGRQSLRGGGYNSYAIRSDGTLWVWGYASSTGRGVLARNLATPTRLDLP